MAAGIFSRYFTELIGYRQNMKFLLKIWIVSLLLALPNFAYSQSLREFFSNRTEVNRDDFPDSTDVTGELFHELKRKEVQMELIMIILPLIFGAFTSYRLYLHRKKSQKMALNKWINKDFHDVLNISLNTIVRCRSFTTQQNGMHINPYNYHIHYRTLIEKDAKSVINDEHGIAVLTSSLKKCVDQNQEVIRIDGNHKNDRDAHC